MTIDEILVDVTRGPPEIFIIVPIDAILAPGNFVYWTLVLMHTSQSMAEFVENVLLDVCITGGWVDVHCSFILAEILALRAYKGEASRFVESDANLRVAVLDEFKFDICVLCPLGSVLSNLKKTRRENTRR